MRRFLSSQGTGSGDAGFGPVFEVHGHVALLPLVRVGLYASHDLSPETGVSTRHITSGGLRVKVTSPWPHDKWRLWAFAGIGYAGAYAESFHRSFTSTGGVTSDVVFPGASGSYFEVPLGVGVGYRLVKGIDLTMQLGTRFGLGFSGSIYPDRTGGNANLPDIVATTGNDSFAISLALGLSFEL